MTWTKLRKAVEAHSGSFYCTQLGNDSVTKEVRFEHQFEPASATDVDIELGDLSGFYQTFSCLRLYCDPVSGQSAFYLGAPDEWQWFDADLREWFVDLSEKEAEELLPPWIEDCLVIGEIPETGNYLIMPLSGEQAGCIVEFEHDGFEFIQIATDMVQLLEQWLNPDQDILNGMASHMRFVEESNRSVQWLMTEMRDNQGNCLNT